MGNRFDIETCDHKEEVLESVKGMYSPYRPENFSEALWHLKSFEHLSLIYALQNEDWELAGQLLDEYVKNYMMQVAYEDIMKAKDEDDEEEEEEDDDDDDK